MWIELGNRTARVVRADDRELNWLRDYLSFPDADARFKPGSDGQVRMLNVFTNTFPAGFLPLVRRAAPAVGTAVEIIDKRTPPAAVDPAADVAWLRDYQHEAVRRVLDSQRGILWMTTGAGKTEIAVALARAVPCPWLFVVHRKGLADQAADRFALRNREHGVDLGEPGVIGEGAWSEGERFTAATFQSLVAAMKDPRRRELIMGLLARVGGLIVDESHTLPATSFYDVVTACDAYYRVGLSGTPLARGDQRSILSIAALGPVIYRVRPEVLVNAGVLARARVRFIACTQPAAASATYQGVYNQRVVRSAARNTLVTKIAAAAAKPCLLFVKQIEHGRVLEAMLAAAGVRNEFVFGAHSVDYRKSVVRRMLSGAFDVVICSVVFQEGIDIPDLRSVINAAGSKSAIATLQRLGRGMRIDRAPDGSVKPGGDVFEMWDVDDRGNKWLERHSRARRSAYISEGHETVVSDTV